MLWGSNLYNQFFHCQVFAVQRFFAICNPSFYLSKKCAEFLFHIFIRPFLISFLTLLFSVLLCSLWKLFVHFRSHRLSFPACSVSWQLLSDTGFLSLVRFALPLSICSCASLLWIFFDIYSKCFSHRKWLCNDGELSAHSHSHTWHQVSTHCCLYMLSAQWSIK